MTYNPIRIGDAFKVDWGDTSKTKSSYTSDGYPAYSASGPDGYMKTFDYASPGIVLSAIGANCGVTYFADGKWSAIKNTICIFPKSKDHSIDFLYYFTKNIKFFPKRGSAQPFISKKDVEDIVIELPPLSVQLEISSVLRQVDLMINSNLKKANALDSLGQQIFDLFINPEVSGILNGKAYKGGVPPHFNEVFNKETFHSTLGDIPLGWSVKKMTEVGSFLNGLAAQNFPTESGNAGLPVLKIAQLRDRTTRGADVCSSSVEKKYLVNDGDMIFSWSASLDIDCWTGGKAVLNQHLFKVKGIGVPDWFIFYAVKKYLPWFRMIASGKATTMGHIQRSHLDEALLIVPDNNYLLFVDNYIKPILEARNSLLRKVSLLNNYRDLLFLNELKKVI
jgi:type I restriction enzyme S subunit